MYAILAFFSCYILSVKSIYVANILFLIILLLEMLKKGTFSILNMQSMKILVAYLLWSLFSTVVFALQYDSLTFRSIFQYFYNLQYFLWLVVGTIDKEKFKKWFALFANALAIVLIFCWIATGTASLGIINTLSNYREWGIGIFPGWPNSTVLPLIFGLYLDLKSGNRIKLLFGVFVSIALLLTTSRTGLIGAALLFMGYMFSKNQTIFVKGIKFISIVIVLAIAILVILNEGSIASRLFMAKDRVNIYLSCLDYLKDRPLLGYGGNSFDVVYNMFGSRVADINWGHTHNTVFELLLRHGIVGTGLYFIFIVSLFTQIDNKTDKVAFIIFWILSLFQIYYRDFIFLIIIFLLLPSDKVEKQIRGLKTI